MKKMIAAGLLCLGLLVASCDDYDTIEDGEMEDILSEVLLTNAIATRAAGFAEVGSTADTVDYYTLILDQYDYTLDDFRGTIREMAMRKSNPLAEIFVRVNLEIDSLAAMAEYRYRNLLRYDSTALAFYRDTLYAKDTTVRGSLDKLRVPVSKPNRGTYTFTFKYRSTADYLVPSKSVVCRTSPKGEPIKRFWIDRVTNDTAQFTGDIVLDRPYDTLIVSFEGIGGGKKDKKNREKGRDTSFVQNLRLTYTPTLAKARRDFSTRWVDLYHCSPYLKPYAQDSLPFFTLR